MIEQECPACGQLFVEAQQPPATIEHVNLCSHPWHAYILNTAQPHRCLICGESFPQLPQAADPDGVNRSIREAHYLAEHHPEQAITPGRRDRAYVDFLLAVAALLVLIVIWLAI